MQKIIIKNFGAVKDAEIEIKSLLVLIGEQASGKSTIAKLIYFFKSVSDDFFNQFYKVERDYLDITADFIFPLREKFYDFFGSTFHLPDFEIVYYYDTDNYLKLTLDKQKKLHPEFSQQFLDTILTSELNQIKSLINNIEKKIQITAQAHEKIVCEQNKLTSIQELSVLINNLFSNTQNNALYIIAGRNATVSYTEMFEKYLFANILNKLEDNRKQSFKKKEQTIDESLMLKFVEHVFKNKDLLKKYGSFNGLIKTFTTDSELLGFLNLATRKINEILKGEYIIDQWGEKIKIDKNSYVYLHNASSGQQEIIRILQDIFLVIFEEQKSLRIIEEPEAHLFPVAQKQTIELLALMLNANPHNQLIITTHSPYVLTSINNLLFAHRVVEKNPNSEQKINEVIDKRYILNPNTFSAYSLGNSLISNNYCENIFNSKTGLIKQSYLDVVSEMLSGDFNLMYDIHSQKYIGKNED
jgi:ABC-type dipeptide/oligopeptide/nickel transport system ATPase component